MADQSGWSRFTRRPDWRSTVGARLRVSRRYVNVGKDGAVTLVAGRSGTAQNFQWIKTPTGELVLMSLATNRFLCIDPQTRDTRADRPGTMPDDSDGARFIWSE